MPIAKKTNISIISQSQKHIQLNMPITATNISTSQSKKLKIIELIRKTQTFKYANRKIDKHFNKPITKTQIFKCANHRHKHFNEPITKSQAFK